MRHASFHEEDDGDDDDDVDVDDDDDDEYVDYKYDDKPSFFTYTFYGLKILNSKVCKFCD